MVSYVKKALASKECEWEKLTSTPGRLISPIAFAAPRTAAESPMSNFMSSIEEPGQPPL